MFISAFDLTGEVQVELLSRDGEYLAVVPIGRDDVEGTRYSVLVALAPLIGYTDLPGYELVFNIVAADEGGDTVAFHDGADTRHILCEPALRRRVRALICQLVAMLIDEADPALVSMVTYKAGLPPRALNKYYEICAIFAGKGYRAGKSDVWHGQHTWMMQRLSGTSAHGDGLKPDGKA